MSFLANEHSHSQLEGKYNTTNGSVNHGYEISEPTHIINECLDALLYQDAAFRPLTHSTIKLIEEAKPRIGEANALFIEGIRMYLFVGVQFKLFAQAEEKGCKHPVLYYFMGRCYMDGDQGVDQDFTKALEYYEKAIAGGCSWGLVGRHHLLRLSDYFKALHNLLDLEREGHIDGVVFKLIADCHLSDLGSSDGESMAKAYYQQAIDYGYAHAAVNQSGCLDSSRYGDSSLSFLDKRVLFLVEADNRTIGAKDDRILKEAIELLIIHRHALFTLKNRGEMALQYSDVLIQRRSPLGYQVKSKVYVKGISGAGGLEKDLSKAVAIWEEAGRLGLATSDMCEALQSAYSNGCGVPINGLKVLEYCEKALQLAPSDGYIEYMSDLMARVYKDGIEPVKKDGRKVVDCYERALQSTSSSSVHLSLLKKLAQIYIEGRHSVPPNRAKALEYYIKALEYGRKYYQFDIYRRMATVYERGVPPVAQSLDLANELRRMTGLSN